MATKKKSKATKSDQLTPKQQLFVEEYLIDFNGTKAAIRAKYSKKTAGIIAHENLKKPYIIKAIQERRDQILKSKESSPEKVIERVLNRSVSNINDYYEEVEIELEGVDSEGETYTYTKKVVQLIPPTRLSREAGARIKAIKVEKDGSLKYELYSAHSSDELLAKCHNLLVQKIEHSGPDGKPMEAIFNINFVDHPKKEE